MDGYCYPQAEIAAVTAYKGTCHAQTDLNLDLEVCSMDSGSLICHQIMSTDECENGIAYLSKTIGGKQDTTFYDSCEFEWYAEYSCQPPVLECPGDYLQVGDFGAHISEGFLERTVWDRTNTQGTIEECKSMCDLNPLCVAYTYARPGEEESDKFVCTSYDSVVPTGMEGSKIFCKSKDAPSVGTVAFDVEFDFINNECGDMLKPLRQVVARVSRVELRHVRAEVTNCEVGSFNVAIACESSAEMQRLRREVESAVFISRLNNELGNHGKSMAGDPKNISTSDDSKSYKTEFVIVKVILCVFVVAFLIWLITQSEFCRGTNGESGGLDPEMGEKRQPKMQSEISLKTIAIPEFVSNSTNSMTMYDSDLGGNSTSPRLGETTTVQ